MLYLKWLGLYDTVEKAKLHTQLTAHCFSGVYGRAMGLSTTENRGHLGEMRVLYVLILVTQLCICVKSL